MPIRALLIASLALWALSGAATAKPARCFTTDDGEYDCRFSKIDAKGSFDLTAPGKPTFSLIIEEPGVASGYADFGEGSVFLPGKFLRSESDLACWVNDQTGTRICAW